MKTPADVVDGEGLFSGLQMTAVSSCGAKGRGVKSLYKVSDPVGEDPTLRIYSPPKALPPPVSHQGVKTQFVNSWRSPRHFLVRECLLPQCQSVCALPWTV